MFEKLKELKKLKELQGELGKEKAEAEKNGVKVVVNGKMEIEEVVLNGELNKESQEEAVKNCANEAMKKIQMLAARKMFKM
ncbi:YbaB/EbfC family nucleoid-associated protein [Patescibacteria group bacterium]|nr:YbaB/EbfC family nucleoid-associated protein [Patescibacteria group bacterium]MBU2579975.1 YbaB/EbfC family nucleoid-associated protein [Patescibacteria group bacterium]